MINIYCSDETHQNLLSNEAQELKGYFAEILSCRDIRLKPNEITIRFILTPSVGMITPLEIEMFAHAFGERVERQDEHVSPFECIYNNYSQKSVT